MGRKDTVDTDNVALTLVVVIIYNFSNIFIIFLINNHLITLSGGSLGSRIDEERSKAR